MSPEDFEALYHEYRDLVWGMIHRSGVAGPDRDDVFMETWEAVWRAADSFTGECRISTWIAGIARHKAIDSLRKRRALCLPDPDLARILDESDHPRFFPPPPLPTDAQAQSGELKDAIRQALDSLTPIQAFALGKRLEGFSYREIAEIWNGAHPDPVDEGGIGKQIYLARTRIAGSLKRLGFTPAGNIPE